MTALKRFPTAGRLFRLQWRLENLDGIASSQAGLGFLPHSAALPCARRTEDSNLAHFSRLARSSRLGSYG